ncbi:MAG TPA: hypothetical protein VN676_17045 [Steroidobacteraceae bacterium]|jgi:hypothetical protein|nr:hypothetical protein [Steroidobacteraceae bacterium]
MRNSARLQRSAASALSGLLLSGAACAAIPVTSLPSDTPATFKPVTASFD